MISLSLIVGFIGPTWGPPGSCRPQMGPMLAPWTLLSGILPVTDSSPDWPYNTVLFLPPSNTFSPLVWSFLLSNNCSFLFTRAITFKVWINTPWINMMYRICLDLAIISICYKLSNSSNARNCFAYHIVWVISLGLSSAFWRIRHRKTDVIWQTYEWWILHRQRQDLWSR